MQDIRQILKQYHPILFKIGRAYAPDNDDFKDLYQEMVIQIWKSMDQFESRSSLSTWIYRVSLNTALTYRRKEKRKQQVITRELPFHPGEIPDDPQQDSTAQINLLYKAIAKLSEEDRALILLHLDGKKYKEISDILGISGSNVGVKLLRIRKKLFTMLNELGYATL